MNRITFLKTLEVELDGQISPAEINQNLHYYDSYIREQMEKGMQEEEVMAQLGDPRLIARTICDTAQAAGQVYYEEEDYTQEKSYGDSASYDRKASQQVVYINGKAVDFSKWYVKLLTAVIALLTLAVVISLLVLIIRVAIWLALPALVICGIIYILQHFFYR